MQGKGELKLPTPNKFQDSLGLRLAGWAGAGVLPVAGLTDRPPPQREVPIEINLVGVVAILSRLAVGVHRLDEPQFDAVWSASA